jgi:hypothetical protein
LNYDAKLAELRQLEGVVHAAGMLVAYDGAAASLWRAIEPGGD